MATPSPAEPPAGETPPPPPAKVVHHDSRSDFIPDSSLHGRYETGAGSISQLGLGEAPSTLRMAGAEAPTGSYRPRNVPGSHLADLVIVAVLVVGVIAYLVWRHFQSEAQENFAGQDHNKD